MRAAIFSIVIFSLFSTSLTVQADPLNRTAISLHAAIEQALQHDANLQAITATKESWEHLSHAAQGWDDPKLRFGAQAIPIDSFDLKQEPMSQLVLGYQQTFPRGDSLKNRSAMMSASAEAADSQRLIRERQIILGVRKNWYEIQYLLSAIHVIEENRKVFEEMLDINQAFYASGRTNQQSLIQSELDVFLVVDKLHAMQATLSETRISLSKWLGEYKQWVPDQVVTTSYIPNRQLENFKEKIQSHPDIKQAEALLKKQQSALSFEENKYSAQWGLDVRYGYRQGENNDGSERADFLTAMVTVDLPLFSKEKQDRQVAASRSQVKNARFKIIDVKRDLVRRLEQILIKIEKLQHRLILYKENIKPQAKHNSEISMQAYQSGVVDFLTFSKAQISEFNALMSELMLQYELNVEIANLKFLTGEKK